MQSTIFFNAVLLTNRINKRLSEILTLSLKEICCISLFQKKILMQLFSIQQWCNDGAPHSKVSLWLSEFFFQYQHMSNSLSSSL